VDGALNADFELDAIAPFAFKGDFKIDSLKVFGNHFGNLHASANTNQNGEYMLHDLSLTGEGNGVKAKGYADSSLEHMDFTIAMHPLNLAPVAPFVKSYLDSLKGGIGGDLHVFGGLKNPMLEGELHFEKTSFIARQTGTYLNILNGGIHLNEHDITFDDILFADSAGNKGSITGAVNIKEKEPISYQLKLEANNFLVSGYERYDEQLISGPLSTDLRFNIKGDLHGASIDGNAKVLDGSKMRYVYESSLSSTNGDGLIEFFNPLYPEGYDSLNSKAKKKKSSAFKLQVNSYINITPKSELTVVLDEMAGDRLQVRGTTNLNFTMTPDGDMQLVGNYEVESGTYNLSIAGLLRKEFAIQKGSTIDWAGDILKAKTNLKAAYNVKTDASELLQGRETVAGASRQKLDFIVIMMIKGELLKPDISFQLNMAEKDQDAFDGIVYTRVKQVNTIPSELNKQVMGLLALNSFIADNPFNSIGGGNFETEAYATAGKLLTQELNNFIGDNIKNVDIDIGLDIRDDYSSGKAQRNRILR
jgi:translocation and assembly module TamB